MVKEQGRMEWKRKGTTPVLQGENTVTGTFSQFYVHIHAGVPDFSIKQFSVYQCGEGHRALAREAQS